ncbi:MAG: metallophosphoesterase, partial [Selenomonas sp.]|nr:metallophosphoesterase [Selenomonas sp.]
FKYAPASQGPVYLMSGPIGNQQYNVPEDKHFDKSAIYQPTPPNYLLLEASQERLTVTCLTAAGDLVEKIEI